MRRTNYNQYNTRGCLGARGPQGPTGAIGVTGVAGIVQGQNLEPTIPVFGADQASVTIPGTMGLAQNMANMTNALLNFTCYVQTPIVVRPDSGFYMQWKFTVNGVDTPLGIYYF